MSICLWVIVLTRDHGQSVDLVEQIIWRVYCQVFFASYHQRMLQQVNIWFCKLEDFLPKWYSELGIMISFGSTFAQDFWILTCSRVMWLAFPTRNYRMLAYLHSYIILFHLRYMVSTPDIWWHVCSLLYFTIFWDGVCLSLCDDVIWILDSSPLFWISCCIHIFQPHYHLLTHQWLQNTSHPDSLYIYS